MRSELFLNPLTGYALVGLVAALPPPIFAVITLPLVIPPALVLSILVSKAELGGNYYYYAPVCSCL
jgi:hypothetical protein